MCKEGKDLHLFLDLVLLSIVSCLELFCYYSLDAGNQNKNHTTYVTSWFIHIFNEMADVKNRLIQNKQKFD